MRKINRNNLKGRITRILGNNDGASLVLVSVLAIIVLTAVVVLRVTTTTFMASANRQLNQDQAYELAASLGESIDLLISEGKYDINKVELPADVKKKTIYSLTNQDNKLEGLSRDASVKAVVSETEDGKGRVLTVTANVGTAEYVFTREYRS
ncbi:MAG: hypothetical protein IKE92_00135 [Clostridiales bacterium]|nr:hypothetical protein [Clostridiales bacterium]